MRNLSLIMQMSSEGDEGITGLRTMKLGKTSFAPLPDQEGKILKESRGVTLL